MSGSDFHPSTPPSLASWDIWNQLTDNLHIWRHHVARFVNYKSVYMGGQKKKRYSIKTLFSPRRAAIDYNLGLSSFIFNIRFPGGGGCSVWEAEVPGMPSEYCWGTHEQGLEPLPTAQIWTCLHLNAARMDSNTLTVIPTRKQANKNT